MPRRHRTLDEYPIAFRQLFLDAGLRKGVWRLDPGDYGIKPKDFVRLFRGFRAEVRANPEAMPEVAHIERERTLLIREVDGRLFDLHCRRKRPPLSPAVIALLQKVAGPD